MKWFKKMLWRWASEGQEVKECNIRTGNNLVGAPICDAVNEEPILNFKVFSAVGGKVVEFRRFDRRSERHDSTTYIITNDQDFGDRIAKIATLENLKN